MWRYRHRGRDGIMRPQAKECLRHPELERLQRECSPANTLSLDLESPELWGDTFLLFQASLWCFVTTVVSMQVTNIPSWRCFGHWGSDALMGGLLSRCQKTGLSGSLSIDRTDNTGRENEIKQVKIKSVLLLTTNWEKYLSGGTGTYSKHENSNSAKL